MENHEILESTGKTVAYLEYYLKQQRDFIKLELAERTAKVLSFLITSFIFLQLVVIIFLFLSLSLAFYLASVFGSYVLAFLAIAGGFTLIALIIYYFKSAAITNPVLTALIKEMFD